MFKRILVPLDGSKRAERAIPVAARIAHTSSASLTLLQVVPPTSNVVASMIEAPGWMQQVMETTFAEVKRYLDQVAVSSQLIGIHVTTEVLFGTVADTILSTAEEEDVDLI